MSNIRFEKKGANTALYKIILEEAITDVKKKAGIVDDGIEWVIFNEKDHIEKNVMNKIMPSYIYNQNFKYGFCYVEKKQIWISVKIIMTSNVGDFQKKFPQIGGKQKNLLINVILDEVAHIMTGKDHGDKEYDNMLENYHKKYYGK